MSKTLQQLLPGTDSAIPVLELTLDSRRVRPGALFLAVPGRLHDGRQYIADALACGASAVAYEETGASLPSAGVPLIPVQGLAWQLSAIAGRFYDDPSHSLKLIGATGTNGKTSVTQLLAQALDLMGDHCGIIGTLGTGFHGHLQTGLHTTPDALSIQAQLADLQQKGARSVAMEVSSHGLVQGRVAALDFDIAVFTNLSRDHLDYHGSMEAYAAAKARLFDRAELRCRVVNRDDPFGRQLIAKKHPSTLIDYSLSDPAAALFCRSASFGEAGIQAEVQTAQGSGLLCSRLLGRFNLSNLLAVIGTLLGLGHPLDEILPALSALQAPAGRMQRLGGAGKPLVVVDYAHTPDALEKVLSALRPHTAGRLICLFGCGGDRDKGKRPLMARIAEAQADLVWVADDNPRTEVSSEIITDIRQGFERPERVHIVAARAEAIARAIGSASADDVVVLAGKGHEDYQEINGVRHPFSDIRQAQKALAEWEVAHA